MKKLLVCMLTIVIVASCAGGVWAATSQTVNINASVPLLAGSLSVGVSKITGSTWTSATSISFGTLTWNTTNHIFLADSYFAVDTGVVDNSGTAWTITHTRTSLAGNGSLSLIHI